MSIRYIDRQSKQEKEERIYGGFFLRILYGNRVIYRILSFFLLPLIARISFFSKIYGAFQKSRWSRSKIFPFVEKFEVDALEFLDPLDSYRSFNDFFVRKLKPSCRPINPGNDVAILPADGRYLVFPNVEKSTSFYVKGKKLTLEKLLGDRVLAHKYAQGTMVFARLSPVDYHRFHFLCNCVPEPARLINGPLFSVNPMALKRNIQILSENKRMITFLHTKHFGTVLFIEVGATYVGSICQTFAPGEHYAKGDEKGFFSFGGSSLILLFEPFRIELDRDLVENTSKEIETRGLFGQSLGRALSFD